MKQRHVVTSILMNKGKVLILKRSKKVGSFRGKWAGVSGFIEKNETPLQAAFKEIREETCLKKKDVKLWAKAEPVTTRKGGIEWVVHPFLFETRTGKIKTDWEHDCCEWIHAKDMKKYKTVPRLEEIAKKLLDARKKKR